MKVYLAAPWKHRGSLPQVAALFEAAGHTITEKWWEHHDTKEVAELERQAVRDFEGVACAEAFVLMNTAPSSGKTTEFGIALAHRSVIFVLGTGGSSNIFYHMPGVRMVDSIGEILEALEA